MSSSILLTLSLLPALVRSYNCNNLNQPNWNTLCDHSVPGPMVSFPQCLVRQDSVSAFIQCADVTGYDAPSFSITEDGEESSVGPLDLLTATLSDSIACESCPLTGNIQKAAKAAGPYHQNFKRALCALRVVDAGMCCLYNCLGKVAQEHSIEAFCNQQVNDLTEAPLVPKDCKSNAVQDDTSDNGYTDGDDADDTSNGDTSSDDTNDYSFSSSSYTTAPSTVATTSPVLGTAAPTTMTSTQAPSATSNVGAGSRLGEQATSYVDRLKKLGLMAFPIMAVF